MQVQRPVRRRRTAQGADRLCEATNHVHIVSNNLSDPSCMWVNAGPSVATWSLAPRDMGTTDVHG